ncbi:leucine-rich repeat and death domain-containing protein 1 isoform X3 [Eurytemora carolleeae]|uniref:leucine-rich repeat and death domain-containing protein 1 isoform X3 n=1 Tax=Eurytemora carolleeae TaxID=1294199 RepID=UPI000C75A81C|nr:leucine-rich repeat and death domain-containing protein 1 isoform X3 [Eurytemora carolleeae]|eukprot:XP_023319757.1 leucine-rich repeat and death domain-containing protein 1-like isoform X3 [Eurytemora affinis]
MVDNESSSIPVRNISSETSDKRTENDNFCVESKTCEQNLKTLIAQLNLYPKHLTVIDLSNLNLVSLPDKLTEFHSLKSINFSYNKISVLPVLLEKFQHLEEIIGRDNRIENLDYSRVQEPQTSHENDSIYTDEELSSSPAILEELDFINLPCLNSLDLSGNYLVEFPPSLCKMKNLLKLNLSRNKLRCLPELFCSYQTIKHLILEENGFQHLYEFPAWFYYMRRCSVLSFGSSYLGSIVADIPHEFGFLCRQVVKLDLRNSGIKEFPVGFTSLLDLEILHLSNTSSLNPPDAPCPSLQLKGYKNVIWTLPKKFSNLIGLVHLEASNINLTCLPPRIGSIRNLRYLDLSKNSISGLPDDIVNLSRLETLNLSANFVSNLPTDISKMTSLKILDISFNSIYGFPDEIADLTNLQLLDAYSNKISEIHPSFLSLNLTALDLCENQITVKSLNEQLGSEFVSKYQTLERTLRRMENYQHQHRANLVQMTEEIKETGLSDESRENLDSDQEDYWYHNQDPAPPSEGVVEITSDEEDWDEFQPKRLGNNYKQKRYSFFPEVNVKSLYCPGDSHKLSYIKPRRMELLRLAVAPGPTV